MERDRWRGVELRHLVALEAVGRLRSFGAAARELGYTQSAVSQQVAQLEKVVGQKLVDRPRGPRRGDLTDAGPPLLRHADAIVALDSELAGRDSAPSLRELSGVPLIGWRNTGEPETYLRGRVPELNIVFRTDDNGTLLGLVAEGLGVAVVPRLVVNPRNPSIVALPFGTRIPPRDIAIVWHRDRFRSAAAQAFAELARDIGAEYVATTGSSSATAASTSRRPGR